MEFTYKRESHMGFEETVEAVERSVRARGFNVERSHDLQATLAAKGFQIQPLKIFELSVVLGSAELGAGTVPPMLCRVHVYKEGEDVYVSAIRSSVMLEVLVEGNADAYSQAVEQRVIDLVDAAAG